MAKGAKGVKGCTFGLPIVAGDLRNLPEYDVIDGDFLTTLTSYDSMKFDGSPSTSGRNGGSQARATSVGLVEVTRTLLTDALVADASVVTVMSINSGPPLVILLTPFSANTKNLYAVTGLNPLMVIFVSLNFSCEEKRN